MKTYVTLIVETVNDGRMARYSERIEMKNNNVDYAKERLAELIKVAEKKEMFL